MSDDAGAWSGTLLGESLQPGMALEDIPLTVTSIRRVAAGDAEAGAAGAVDIHRVPRRR